MAVQEPKKMAPLRILQILQKHSDADHPLKQEDIARHLKNDFRIEMERKAIGRTIADLKDADFEIESTRKGCFLSTRQFEDAELRLLIDGVLQSKHISAKHSADLIARLCALSNKFVRSHVKNVYSVNEWNKTENQSTFLNIEVIDEAIAKGKQVQYEYNKYGIDGKLHKTRKHRVSPYQLILHNQRYYLMGFNSFWGSMVFHRLDHITGMSITDVTAIPITEVKGYENGVDYQRIATAMPYLYTDTPERIEMVADLSIVDQIVDWFGQNAKMTPHPENDKKIVVSLIASPMAMEHWATQYLNYVVVTSPAHLRDKIKASLARSLEQYR